MVYFLIGLAIGLGILLYFEYRQTQELMKELKLAQGIRDSLLKREIKEHTEKLTDEQKKKQEEMRKSFNNMMDYDYDIALGNKEE